MMTRILCIVASMDTGGAETFLMKIFRKIDKNNFQMDFCVGSDKKGYYDDEIDRLGGKIYKVTMKSKSIFAFCRELKSLIDANRYDCVIRIGASSFTAIDLWIAKMCGVNCRILRSSNAGTLQDAGIHRVVHKLFRRPLTSVASIKIAPSRLAGEYTFGKKTADKELVLLKNGLNISDFTFSSDDRETVRKSYGLNDKIVVGHIGRFNLQKNHDYLINVFKAFLVDHANSCLLLVGTGERIEEVKKIVKEQGMEDKVIFAGVCSNVPQLLMAMDILVFPSLYEGMPNVVIEAQATGLPCVISDTITEEAKVTDLVIMKSIQADVEEWTVAITTLLQQSKDRFSYASKMRENGYDIDDVVSEFCRLLKCR